MHPLLQLAASRPELLAQHAEAYAELLGAASVSMSARWKRRGLLLALALCGTAVRCVLAGTAVMLWAVMPQLSAPPWLLVVTPSLPLLGAAGCLWFARDTAEHSAFMAVQQQLRADLALWREAA